MILGSDETGLFLLEKADVVNGVLEDLSGMNSRVKSNIGDALSKNLERRFEILAALALGNVVGCSLDAHISRGRRSRRGNRVSASVLDSSLFRSILNREGGRTTTLLLRNPLCLQVHLEILVTQAREGSGIIVVTEVLFAEDIHKVLLLSLEQEGSKVVILKLEVSKAAGDLKKLLKRSVSSTVNRGGVRRVIKNVGEKSAGRKLVLAGIGEGIGGKVVEQIKNFARHG